MAPALLVALCALALAGSASADNLVLRPRVAVTQQYDDNVRSLADDPVDDMVTTFAPGALLRYRTERGGGNLGVDLRAHQYWDNSDLNGLDRTAAFDGDYTVTERFTVSTSGRYDYYENTDDYQQNQDILAGNPDTESLAFSGSARYSLGSRTALALTPTYYRSEYSEQELPYCFLGNRRLPGRTPPCGFFLTSENGVNVRIPTRQPVLEGSLSDVWGVEAGLDRNVTVRDTASLRFGESWRDFERGSTRGSGSADNSNTVDSADLGWKREWTPRFTTRISLGVERIQSDTQPVDVVGLGYQTFTTQATLPAFDDTSVIGTGGLEFEYQGRDSLFSMRYSRQSNPSVSYGTSLDTQSVNAVFQHRVNARLSFDLLGFWSSQKSLGDSITELDVVAQPFSSTFEDLDGDGSPETPSVIERASCGPDSVEVVDVDEFERDAFGQSITRHLVRTDCLGFSSQQADQDSLGFTASVNWQMTRRFSTFLRYRWYQRSTGGDTRLSDYDKNVFTLGFTYNYDVGLY